MIDKQAAHKQQRYLYHTMKQVFFWLLLISSFFACTNGSGREKTSARCYVRYLAPEGRVMAEFSLRVEKEGDSAPQPVEVPDGARYQGVLMNLLPVQGMTYQLEQSGGFAVEHQFNWKDLNDQKQQFKMSMEPIRSFSFDPTTLSNQAPATLRWDGPPLEQGESLVLMWELADGSRTVPMELIASSGQSQIDFPVGQMAKLDPGKWSLYLVRKKKITDEVAGTSIIGALEYYTQVDTLEVQ